MTHNQERKESINLDSYTYTTQKSIQSEMQKLKL